MKKNSILGLIAFACLTIASLVVGVNLLICHGTKDNIGYNQPEEITSTEDNNQNKKLLQTQDNYQGSGNGNGALISEEPWLSTNPSDIGIDISSGDDSKQNHTQNMETDGVTDTSGSGTVQGDDTQSTIGNEVKAPGDLQLIFDCKDVDYYAYIPKPVIDSKIEGALDIQNPEIDLIADAAILIDTETNDVLYHKNAVEAVFPASTAKLLSALVAIDWCELDEEVTIGEEIDLIASDSSIAGIKKGQVLTVSQILEGMLLPSGNDAAYAMAAYVGRKSLNDPDAKIKEAVIDFVRMMNEKAVAFGVKNSCFKTPDGYDALGQYTTAYDMGLISLEALKNDTIMEICKKGRSRNVFVSGEDITWYNTNRLIKKNDHWYYSYATGLKTGTSTMAGGCLVAAAKKDNKEVMCVILKSTASGRYEDAIKLLKYGLN